MVIGVDTGLFIEFYEVNQIAKDIWLHIRYGHEVVVLSSPTIHEIAVHLYRTNKNKELQKFIDLLRTYLTYLSKSSRNLLLKNRRNTNLA